MKKKTIKFFSTALLLFSLWLLSSNSLVAQSTPTQSKFVEKEKIAYTNSMQLLDLSPRIKEKVKTVGATGVIYIDKPFALTNINELLDLSPNFSFEIISERENKKKQTKRIRYQQFYKGIPIENKHIDVRYILSSEEPKVFQIIPSIELVDLKVPIELTRKSSDFGLILNEKIVDSELLISKRYSDSYELVWKVNSADKNGGFLNIIEDESGKVLARTSNIEHIFKDGPTEDYGTRAMDCDDDGVNTELVSEDGEVQTYDFTGGGSPAGTGNYNVNDIPTIPTAQNAWTNTDAAENVFQAHWLTRNSLDAFLDIGIDYELVHVAANVNVLNAFAFNTSRLNEAWIILGEDSGSTFAEYDIIGHELGHVFLYDFLTSNSQGGGIGSASLHEGLSDIFGVYVESSLQGLDWVMGDNVPRTIRDLANPMFLTFPAAQTSTSQHDRSTPLGYWFHLLNVGIATNLDIVPLDLVAIVDIIVESLMILNNFDADYPELRDATLEYIFNEFGGECSQEYRSFLAAWNEIGVNGTAEICVCDTSTPIVNQASASVSCPFLSLSLDQFATGTVPPGANVVWSTDNDRSDGISPIFQDAVESSGTYYAYYYIPAENCYSDPSGPIQVSISPCCSIQSAITIASDITFDSPRAYAAGITINNGGTLTVTDRLEIGTGGAVTVNDGGTLIIEEGQITKCSTSSSWQGVVVNDGGTVKVEIGSINYATNGLRANDGSTVDLSEAGFSGPNGNIAINLQDDVNLINAEDIFISNYNTGILANNASSYYEFNHGNIINVSTGIKLYSSPARIHGFTLRCATDGIDVYGSSGTLIQYNEIYASQNQGIPAITYGIDADYSSSLVIRNNTIGNSQTAVMEGINLQFSSSSLISGNEIRTRYRGIYAAFSDVTINRNEINTLYYSLGGIFIYAATGNQIKNNYIDAIGAEYGIYTVSCHDSEIENNDIFGVVVTGLDRVAAIKSTACTGQTIAGNDISGYGRTTGILAHNTTGNTYECNYVENGDEGLGIYYNSMGHIIQGNNFDVDGNDLAIRSATGPQDHEGNVFKGGDAWAESQTITDFSQFFVNPNILYHDPVNPNPANGWFIEEPDVYNHYVCSGSPGPNWRAFWDDKEIVCSYYNEVISEHGYGSDEYVRMVMTMKRHDVFNSDWILYECIGDSILPECMDKLLSIELQILEFFSDSDKENSDKLRDQLLELADEREMVDSRELSVLTSQVNRGMVQNAESFDNHLERWEEELIRVDCDDFILEKSKEILLAYINHLKTDKQESRDYDELIRLSRLCSDDYGAFVHIARTLANESTDEHFDNFDTCSEAPVRPRIADNIENLSHNIYPNPSTGQVTINFEEAVTGTLSVISSDGQLLTSNQLKNQEEVMLDLANYQGLNLIQFIDDNGEIKFFKAFIID